MLMIMYTRSNSSNICKREKNENCFKPESFQNISRLL